MAMDIIALASDHLSEANAKFTYNGKPMHPLLVKQFSNWISDNRPPIRTTVDVAAAFDTNEYQQDEVQRNGDWWVVNQGEAGEAFGYRWIGKMANGIHVVETCENGGGSGIFMDLRFIKFSNREILWGDKKTKQLLMTVVGTYTLGDRYDGEIGVYPDKVIIPASKSPISGPIEKDVELTFPGM